MKLFYIPVRNRECVRNYENSILRRITINGEKLSSILKGDYALINYGLWGLRMGSSNTHQYNKISKGDILLFSTKDNDNFQCFDGFGCIYSRFVDREISEVVWGSEEFPLLITIDKFIRFDKPVQLVRDRDASTFPSIEGIPDSIWHRGYEMFREWNFPGFSEEKLISILLSKFKYKVIYSVSFTEETMLLLVKDGSEEYHIPQSRKYSINRIIRDSSIIRELKMVYDNCCQICGKSIQLDQNIYYSEGHHIRPLGSKHNGIDTKSNILILCPDHHSMFDYGAIGITKRKESLIIKHKDPANPINGKKLILKHYVDLETIEYHRKCIFEETNG